MAARGDGRSAAGASLAMAGRLAAAALTRSMPARDENRSRRGAIACSARRRVNGCSSPPCRGSTRRRPASCRRAPSSTAANAGRDGWRRPPAAWAQFISRVARAAGRSRRSLLVQHRRRSSRPGDRDGDRDSRRRRPLRCLRRTHQPCRRAHCRRSASRPLVTVTMFFAPHLDDVHGFGVLFPRASGVRALGVLFNTDIFAGRGPARSETWIVGDRDVGMTDWTDDRLREALAGDRQILTGRRDTPLAVHVTRWPQAIPVYDQTIVALKAGAPGAAGLARPRGQLSGNDWRWPLCSPGPNRPRLVLPLELPSLQRVSG